MRSAGEQSDSQGEAGLGKAEVSREGGEEELADW